MVGESCSEGYYGLLDQFGNVVIEMKWEWMGAVEDEVVWIGDETGEVNLLHIPSGKLLLTTGARYCTDFSNGYSGFYRDNKVYFVDQEGHLIETDFIGLEQDPTEEGYFVVKTRDGQEGYYLPPTKQFVKKIT